MSFGKRLRKLRKEKYLTQQELAKLLGIAPSSVGMYEQDRREPDLKIIKKICGIFDVPASVLLEEPKRAQSVDVGEIISDIKRRFQCADGLMFNGAPLSEEDVKKLMTAIEVSAAVVLGDKDN